MTKLSVVIAAKNEEKNIQNCLESVKWADEIIVVDDMSNDGTAEICRKYTERIFVNNSEGSFHSNKNLGIEKATGGWILSIDADEIVSPELKQEIISTLASKSEVIEDYYIPRKNYFLGKWIKGCGWYPDYIIRLFKKGVALWPLEIHKTPKIEGENRAGYLRNPLIHYSYSNLDQYFSKFNNYTSRLAQEEYEKGIRVNRWNFLMLFIIKPLIWFLRKYILGRGFQDGRKGFFISFSSSLVIFFTYAKLRERQNVFKK
jgi:glycosyltransferase involved in cell wall biosynthesis